VNPNQAVRSDADAALHVERHADALLDYALLSKLSVVVDGDLDATDIRASALERTRDDGIQ
jgi:hypothetical protein